MDEATKKDKNPNAPRRLRDKIKEPMKFTPIGETRETMKAKVGLHVNKDLLHLSDLKKKKEAMSG